MFTVRRSSRNVKGGGDCFFIFYFTKTAFVALGLSKAEGTLLFKYP